MKYTCTIEVSLNRVDCVNLWLDESQLNKWQDGFQHKEWISGHPNQTGSVSKILLAQGKRKMELEETIVENNLPSFIEGVYVHIHMTNTQKISFEVITPEKTLVRSEVEYTKFNSFMPKMMAKLFPSLFKKQSQKWLNQFKVLAEK
jgi:uncharacterized membrane protein